MTDEDNKTGEENIPDKKNKLSKWDVWILDARRRRHEIIENLIGAGGSWGLVRLVLALGFVIGMALVTRWRWAEVTPRELPLWWMGGWRYLLPGLAALFAGLLAVANYADRLYNLGGWNVGLRYVLASSFDMGVPVYEVKDGKLTDKQDFDVEDDHRIFRTGGPFCLNVRPGSAVVLESLDRPTRVLGAGFHSVSRLDRIREVIRLSDQTWESASVVAMSKDGIQVDVQRIRYRYRLQPGRRPMDYHKRNAKDPYPFTDKAAQALAYNRTITVDEKPTTWDNTVRLAVEGVVTDEINANWFDEVTAPRHTGEDHRQKMLESMVGGRLRSRLRGIGTDLVWFDIGNFEAKRPEVLRQRVEAWGSKRSGEAGVDRAEGEAYRTAAMQHGRIDAQVDILNAITQAINNSSVPLPKDKDQDNERLMELFLLRTTQILETMREEGVDAAVRKPPAQPASVTTQRMGGPAPTISVDEEHEPDGHMTTHIRVNK